MTLDNILALSAVAFSLLVFLQLGISASRRIKSAEDYLLAGRKLKGVLFQHTFAASTTSLATVLVFFVTTGRLYGWVFLVNLLTFLLGQYLFFKIGQKAAVDLGEFTTISRFGLEHSNSRLTFWTIRVLTVSSFVGILAIEILLGVSIFTYFVGIPNAEIIGFLCISLLMLLYIAVGGFAAVADSDSWQFRLMMAAVGCLLAYFVFFLVPHESWSWSRFIQPTATKFQILTLILNAAVVNLTLPLCQLSSWQRFASTGSWEVLEREFKKGLWKTFYIWGGFIVFSWGLAGAGYELQQITGLFDVLRDPGGLSALFLYPVVFAGLASALLSTADSAAVAVVFEVGDKGLLESGGAWKHYRLRYATYCVILFIVLGLGYWALHSQLQKYFVHLIFVLFSQLIVLFPLLYGLLSRRVHLTRRGVVVSTLGALIGFVIVWSVSVIGMLQTELGWTQFSSFFGLVAAWGALAVGKRVK